jgi:hypothetical protein
MNINATIYSAPQHPAGVVALRGRMFWRIAIKSGRTGEQEGPV